MIVTFCAAFYGSNLWDFGSEEVKRVFNLWNATVRDVFDVPRSTRTHIVENLLSMHRGFKVDLLSRYQKFYMSLLRSPSMPVRVLSALLRNDVRSCSGRNLALITEEAGVDPLAVPKKKLEERLTKRRQVPDTEEWVLEEVNNMLGALMMLKHSGAEKEEVDQVKDMVDCLCVA